MHPIGPSLIPLAVTSVLLGASGAAAAATLELAPTSDWELREYDDKCRIARDFGSGEDAVTLWIDKGGPGPGVNLTFIGRPLRNPHGPTVRFAFEEAEKAERSYIKATSSAGRPVMVLFGVRPEGALANTKELDVAPTQVASGDEEVDITTGAGPDPGLGEELIVERFSAIETIELEGAIADPLTLRFDSFGDAIADLLGCTGELVERLSGHSGEGWEGPLPVEQQRWAAKIMMNYPAHLLRQGEQGSVDVLLTVGKSGQPTFCEVVGFTGPASFNETACLQLLKHARFDPARDPHGEATAAFWQTRVTYKIRN